MAFGNGVSFESKWCLYQKSFPLFKLKYSPQMKRLGTSAERAWYTVEKDIFSVRNYYINHFNKRPLAHNHNPHYSPQRCFISSVSLIIRCLLSFVLFHLALWPRHVHPRCKSLSIVYYSCSFRRHGSTCS